MGIKYFDNSATTQIKEEVFKEMFPYLTCEYGNPSSIYTIGRKAKRAIEEARKQVAGLINCKAEEIIFTSCGSESDNTAIKGIAYAYKQKGNHIITSKIEHPAILNSCKSLNEKGYDITYLNVNKDGIVDLEQLKNNINEKTILISVMLANNEIGTIEPLHKIVKIAKRNNIIVHTDAVQAAGNIDIDVEQLGVDMLSLSGHKIYAPKGIGALYIKSGVQFEKFIDGGHQEQDKRSGTENVAQIVGFGKACQLAKENIKQYNTHLKMLRDYCLEKIKSNISNIQINGGMEQRLPGNLNISFKGVDSGELLLKLDEVGICASGGSACSSKESSPSHVLTAIGVPSQLAKGTIRFTFGEFNKKEDIDYLVENLKVMVKELREE